MAIAPYQVLLTPIGKDEEPMQVAEKLYDELSAKGVEVLLDDRNERPGVKFKDADLLGIPLRVTIGKRGLSDGKLELKAKVDAPPAIDVLLKEMDASAGQSYVEKIRSLSADARSAGTSWLQSIVDSVAALCP